VSERQLRERAELRWAFRRLLKHPLVARHQEPRFGLLQRHERTLVRRFSDLLGYRLVISTDYARLYKRAGAVDATRPARYRRSGFAEDAFPAFDRRRYTYLCLALAVLMRENPQLLLSELAQKTQQQAVDFGIECDFREYAQRSAFIDAIDYLTRWGVLRETHAEGQVNDFRQQGEGAVEVLYTVERGMLGALLATQANVVEAERVEDLLVEPRLLSPGARRRHLGHRIARRLTEEPALYLDELTEDERVYFTEHRRGTTETTLAEYTGLQVERRREGTALIDGDKWLTDFRFPAESDERKAALLLARALADRWRDTGEQLVPDASVRRLFNAALRERADYWEQKRDFDLHDPQQTERFRARSEDVLELARLVERRSEAVLLKPLIGRYQSTTA
jgi:uncharacterized protein (TIGR02678 family)